MQFTENFLFFYFSMKKQHHYTIAMTWTGNNGKGTQDYSSYSRSHTIYAENKPALECSSDSAFRGDTTKYNPEELLVASLSGCHMLWYLHLCADSGIIVIAYTDNAKGMMQENADGSGEFQQVTLYPQVTVLHDSMKEKAIALHEQAHHLCFIARSVRFPVLHEPTIVTG